MCKEREMNGYSSLTKDELIEELEKWRKENVPESKIAIPEDLANWDVGKLEKLSVHRLRTECIKRNLSASGDEFDLVDRLLMYKGAKKARAGAAGVG
jgi:hypothetical protein